MSRQSGRFHYWRWERFIPQYKAPEAETYEDVIQIYCRACFQYLHLPVRLKDLREEKFDRDTHPSWQSGPREDWRFARSAKPCRTIHLALPDDGQAREAYCGYDLLDWQQPKRTRHPYVVKELRPYNPWQDEDRTQPVSRTSGQEIFAVNCPDCLHAAKEQERKEATQQ